MTDVRDVGDWRVPTIDISTADGLPAGGTVTCAVEAPDGTITAVVMSAGTPTATATPWTGAAYELTQAGEYIERFTITGDGKGKARQTVWVQADPGTAPAGTRVYATTTDWANHPAAPVPDGTYNVRRVLLVASSVVEEMTKTAFWETDDTTLLPTDSTVAAALRDATVLQGAYQVGTGDPYGVAGNSDEFQSVTVGGVTLGRSYGSGGGAISGRWSTAAYEVLRAAGLTGQPPLAYSWISGPAL